VKTAIDSNIISAVFCLEPSSPALIALLGRLRLTGALVICGAVYAEVHAIPGMTPKLLEAFLKDTGIVVEAHSALEDWRMIGQVFAAYAERRRKNGDGQGKRLLADFIVGAHAARHCDQLLTLDPKRYSQGFPALTLLEM
jgi:predicted nucleic acid-binding protein